MPFDRNTETGKMQFSFTNLLALIIVVSCLVFLFWVARSFSKAEAIENTLLIQVVTVITATLTAIVMFYFGSSNSASKQAAQITEMQKNATTVALKTADASLAAATQTVPTENKIDKAVKIAELKKALEELEPDSEEAKKILLELEQLEKIS